MVSFVVRQVDVAVYAFTVIVGSDEFECLHNVIYDLVIYDLRFIFSFGYFAIYFFVL